MKRIIFALMLVGSLQVMAQSYILETNSSKVSIFCVSDTGCVGGLKDLDLRVKDSTTVVLRVHKIDFEVGQVVRIINEDRGIKWQKIEMSPNANVSIVSRMRVKKLLPYYDLYSGSFNRRRKKVVKTRFEFDDMELELSSSIKGHSVNEQSKTYLNKVKWRI